MLDRELKKGSAELLILSLVEDQPRHGYDIGTLIETSPGWEAAVQCGVAVSAALPARKRGWIQGRWVEKPGQRRRRYYRLTAEGKKVLASQRNSWREFVERLAASPESNMPDWREEIRTRLAVCALNQRVKVKSSRSWPSISMMFTGV